MFRVPRFNLTRWDLDVERLELLEEIVAESRIAGFCEIRTGVAFRKCAAFSANAEDVEEHLYPEFMGTLYSELTASFAQQ
ncbi:hypothetical protein KM043_008326 [Ampulex compressa]|nr:hypothetical protein KM043_008326 [Ampulex compressa]